MLLRGMNLKVMLKDGLRINHRFDCDSEGVVYLISCKSCGLQYVGNTITAFRLHLTIIRVL